jgi:hypothetical protein
MEYYHDDAQPNNTGRLEFIALATLLDYAVTTYGRKETDTLWAVLHEHKTWETLIPAVFGVPVEEFEAGWQAYLIDMLSSDDIPSDR